MGEFNYPAAGRIRIVIAVHVLPQQGDLPETPSEKIFAFPYDGGRIPAALATPCKGHHTERAHIVAAAHDTDEGGHSVTVQPYGGNIRVGLLPAQQHVDGFLATFRLADKPR